MASIKLVLQHETLKHHILWTFVSHKNVTFSIARNLKDWYCFESLCTKTRHLHVLSIDRSPALPFALPLALQCWSLGVSLQIKITTFHLQTNQGYLYNIMILTEENSPLRTYYVKVRMRIFLSLWPPPLPQKRRGGGNFLDFQAFVILFKLFLGSIWDKRILLLPVPVLKTKRLQKFLCLWVSLTWF